MARYQRAAELEDLIVQLKATTTGLTIEDIQDRYAVSRRTAERMRDAIGERFQLVELAAGCDRKKRWRVEGPRAHALVRWDRDDATQIESAAILAEKDGRQDLARRLRGVALRIRASV